MLLLEVARTPNSLRVGSTRQTFVAALGLVADMVRRGQAAGELRDDIDPGVAAAAMLGALELTLTGMIVGAIGGGEESSEEAVERAKRSVVDLVLGGMLPKAP